MNSSNYLFFPYAIASNFYQNLLREMFLFGIPVFRFQKIKNTEIPALRS
jgi:hypothetical protein